MFDIGSVVAKVKADTTEFQQGIKQVSGGMEGLGGVATKIGAILGGVFAVKKIVDFGKEILSTAGKFEQFQIAFETLLGSAKDGQKLFDDLKEFAKVTPFNFEGLADTTKKLLAYGVAQDDIIPTLRTLGDIASGVGMEKLPQLTLAFGQVKAMGRLTGMELRQFSEAGVPLLQTLADNFKVTTAEMGEMVTGGKIGFEDVKNALGSMNEEGGKFFDLMEKQSGTYLGKLSNMQDAWQQLKATLGDVFLPVATEVIQWFSNLITSIQGAIGEGTTLDSLWLQIKNTWSSVLMFLQPLTDWFTKEVISRLKLIWAELKYFIEVVVPPVIAIVKYLIETIIIPLIQMFVEFWKKNWDHISLILRGAWEYIAGVINVTWALIAGIITTGLLILTGDWKGAWDNIKHYANMAWEGIKGMFNGIVSFLRGWGGWLFDELTAPFRRAWDTIRDLVNKIKDALDFTKRHSPSVVDIVDKGVTMVNRALEGLTVGVEPINTSKLAFSGNGINGMSINIDLSGAYVGDDSIGEKIGDAIISKLQKNVRF